MHFVTKTVAVAATFAGLSAAANTVSGKVLIIGRDDFDVNSTTPGLDAYGIPWQKALIPQAGTILPSLNSTATSGNFGSIILIGSVSYNYNGVFKSALTDQQWNDIFAYQANFNVRMVRFNEYPGPNFGE